MPKTIKKCRKCGNSGKEIHNHHIKAKADGGNGDCENIVYLCTRCHREWHFLIEGNLGISFDIWLKYPTIGNLLSILEKIDRGDMDDINCKDILKWILKAVNLVQILEEGNNSPN